jgi:ApbE superfamily uncharacterized protein (UPF0280 family)
VFREKKRVHVEVAVRDWVLRISAPRNVFDEARVAALQFEEEVSAYGIRDPGFARARRPVPARQDAPPIIKEMARLCRLAGVGPAFAFRGALLHHVGLALSRDLKELTLSSGGDHFVLARKRGRLPLPGKRNLSLVISPELGPNGIHTAIRPSVGGSGAVLLAVVAESCILADAGAAAATVMMARRRSLQSALAVLKAIPGVHGGLIIHGDQIGLAGKLEFAA